MKNLHKLAAECIAELKSIGINPCPVISYSVNTRAVKRWGQCVTHSDGTCDISISHRLLQDDVADQAAKNTIMHELLHSVRGANGGHTGKWAQLASMVNIRLPQYNIERTTNSKVLGLEPVAPRYIVECPTCKKQWTRHRMTKFIQSPGRFRCNNCGTPIVRVQ